MPSDRRQPGSVALVADALRLPGFVNAHSHTFQRALRGRAAGGDFWAWRETMLAEAERQTPELVRTSYERRTARCAPPATPPSGSSTTSGSPEAFAAVEAAARRRDRARRAPRRVRARRARALSPGDGRRVPRRGRGAARRGRPRRPRPPLRSRLPRRLAQGDRALRRARASFPLHVHADEQPQEIEECLAEHGCRPIELLAGPAASASARPSSMQPTPTARSSTCSPRRARSICACPTTEADLGDGFLPAERIRKRAIPLCIGSDSNVRIDPFEELRELEGIARRQTGRRGVFATDELLRFGAEIGARAARARRVARDRDRPRTPLARRSRARARPGRAHCRLRRGRGR